MEDRKTWTEIETDEGATPIDITTEIVTVKETGIVIEKEIVTEIKTEIEIEGNFLVFMNFWKDNSKHLFSFQVPSSILRRDYIINEYRW